MDISEADRFAYGSYPKLKQLVDAKQKLIQARHHQPVCLETKNFKKFDFMQFDNKFDVMVMKLPKEW